MTSSSPGDEQRQRSRLEQLGRAVAQHDLLGRHGVALGEQAADAAGVAVGVAVHAPARARDRRVHDLRVRQVGPLGARQVEVRHPLERQRCSRAARRSRRSPFSSSSSKSSNCR